MNSEENELLTDLLLVNTICAIELLQITENTSKIARQSEKVPPQCIEAHGKLRKQLIDILNKYIDKNSIKNLADHALEH